MKLLIVSDVHGNWPALQAVPAAEGNTDQILCLGGLLDYGPQPPSVLPGPCKVLRKDESDNKRI